ncbi:hypothetical protein CMI47_16515 [Candidatus Pacearchaeota archaeon]|jgi:hypothetical protein|nr:hypothetical protein [Candidatus Pacearchaeota archaeon]|tara:strand:- start:10957 stop:11325 length:369 start_codon:yes stop_codon:yes gene_type:complete
MNHTIKELKEANDKMLHFKNSLIELESSVIALTKDLVSADSINSHCKRALPIISDCYRKTCNIKEDLNDYLNEYKGIIDSMGDDIAEVKINMTISIDKLIKELGHILKVLITINRNNNNGND